MTKTNHIGTVQAFDFPVMNSEAEDFILGARWANPKVKVSQAVIGTLTDVGKARSAAAAEISAGADIVFSATDIATLGIIKAAADHPHTYVIGQYYDLHKFGPSVVLTTVLTGLTEATEKILELGAQGKLQSKNYFFGPAQVGKLAPYYNLSSQIPQSIQKRIQTISAEVRSGKLKVPFIGKHGAGATYPLTKLPGTPA